MDHCCLRYLTQLGERLGVSYPEARLMHRCKAQKSLKFFVKLHRLTAFQLPHGRKNTTDARLRDGWIDRAWFVTSPAMAMVDGCLLVKCAKLVDATPIRTLLHLRL